MEVRREGRVFYSLPKPYGREGKVKEKRLYAGKGVMMPCGKSK